jgi:hypothetical protein
MIRPRPPYTPWIFGAAVVVLAITFTVAFTLMANREPFGGIAASATQSVFLIEVEEGATRTQLGSAFAINSKGTLASNAHIAMELDKRGALTGRGGARALAIQGGTFMLRRITGAAVSPDWKPGSANTDVAFLQLEAGVTPRPLKLGNADTVAQAVRGAPISVFGFFGPSGAIEKPQARLFASFVDEVRTGSLHLGGIEGDASGSPLFNQAGLVVGMVSSADGWAVTIAPVRELLEK